jgi:geranylgeranyl diphosphate synthase type I
VEASASRPVVALPDGLAEIGARVEERVDELLAAELVRWHDVAPELDAPLTALRDLVANGGKRLRPAFCFWGFVGAGGDPADPRVTDVAAAIELLHAFALVHDDVMDGSAVRRGAPTVHSAFAAAHRARGDRGEARRFGEGAAILIGDLAFVYADRLLDPVTAPVKAVYDELRVELCVGQYLDLAGSAHGSRRRADAERIERYKSGKYTVERPLHLGAALAGRLDDLSEPLSRFGLPLGEAFQLRDDLLGVFGDPMVTGKPVGDDLREGKLTPLVAAAVARAVSAEHLEVLARIGDAGLGQADIEAVRVVLVETGAVDEVEETIARRVGVALDALDAVRISADAKHALADLARFVAWRDH